MGQAYAEKGTLAAWEFEFECKVSHFLMLQDKKKMKLANQRSTFTIIMQTSGNKSIPAERARTSRTHPTQGAAIGPHNWSRLKPMAA